MHVHPATGHLTVVPVRRTCRDRVADPPPVDDAAAVRRHGAWRPSCSRRRSAAPPSACRGRSTPRCRGPTTSTRRSSSWRGCRACSRRRWSAPRWPSSGVVLQALLRNPLATPFTLGVSAGAALGAMLAIAFGLDLGALGVSSVPMASFVGSMAATGIVYWLASSQRRGLSTNVLLLAGVTLNSFFSALILFVQYLADFTQSFRTVRWLMGDLDVGSYGPLVAALPLLLLAFAAFAVLPRHAQPAHARHRRGRGPRRGRGARRTRGVRQRVAGHRRGGLAGRADRLHRHRRAAPGAAAGRRRPSAGAAGLGALRRGVPDRLRPGRRARRWRRSSCRSGSSRR